jgi:hypothetical protein
MTKCLLGVLATVLLSGCTGPALGDRRLNTVERMMWSTYPLMTPKGMGTGFVVSFRDAEAPGGVTPVVVTSVHVIETVGRGPLDFALRVPDEQGEPEAVAVRYQPRRGRERFYVRHPRQDLAAFALKLPVGFSDLIPVYSFLDEGSVAGRSATLRAGAEVSFLGFPEVLPGTVGAFPILRTGRVASYPVGSTNAQGLFVINADVYPGDSGAPVFTKGRGGRPELVGMIIRRIGTDERDFSHLAIAVDALAIRETLQLVAEREAKVVVSRGQELPSLRQPPRSGGTRGR